MTHPFDSLSLETLQDKRCGKWQYYPKGVIPLWVADMDFPIADSIKKALHDYIDSDNIGYPERNGIPGLKETVAQRLKHAITGAFNQNIFTTCLALFQGCIWVVWLVLVRAKRLFFNPPCIRPLAWP